MNRLEKSRLAQSIALDVDHLKMIMTVFDSCNVAEYRTTQICKSQFEMERSDVAYMDMIRAMMVSRILDQGRNFNVSILPEKVQVDIGDYVNDKGETVYGIVAQCPITRLVNHMEAHKILLDELKEKLGKTTLESFKGSLCYHVNGLRYFIFNVSNQERYIENLKNVLDSVDCHMVESSLIKTAINAGNIKVTIYTGK